MSIEDDAFKAVTESAREVVSEVYADVAQPSARKIGTALETVFKVGLSPISILDWGFEHSRKWLIEKIAERLAEIPEDFRTAPPNNISVPVLTNIAMASEEPELRNLYAELLLKAMDRRTSDMVHPSYVAVISQLCPEEAHIFVSFHGNKEDHLFKENVGYLYYSPDKKNISIEKQFETY